MKSIPITLKISEKAKANVVRIISYLFMLLFIYACLSFGYRLIMKGVSKEYKRGSIGLHTLQSPFMSLTTLLITQNRCTPAKHVQHSKHCPGLNIADGFTHYVVFLRAVIMFLFYVIPQFLITIKSTQQYVKQKITKHNLF